LAENRRKTVWEFSLKNRQMQKNNRIISEKEAGPFVEMFNRFKSAFSSSSYTFYWVPKQQGGEKGGRP
jgi:hypothetical protein